jgi:hypothetical protein
MADPLLAKSAIDRLASTYHELVIEGDSYRRHAHHAGRSLGRGNTPVPSSWRATAVLHRAHVQRHPATLRAPT